MKLNESSERERNTSLEEEGHQRVMGGGGVRYWKWIWSRYITYVFEDVIMKPSWCVITTCWSLHDSGLCSDQEWPLGAATVRNVLSGEWHCLT